MVGWARRLVDPGTLNTADTVNEEPVGEDDVVRSQGDEPTAFGSRLRALRVAAGLTQTELAGGDLSPSYVSHLESGRRTPTAEAAAVLAARLGVHLRDLLPSAVAGPGEQLVLAQAALGLGSPQEALDLLEPWAAATSDADALAADASLVAAAECRALALERLGRLVEAAALLERVREASEASPRTVPWVAATVSLLRVYRESGDLARAADVGEAALDRGRRTGLDAGGPGWAALVSTVAGVHAERGDLVRAQGVLDDLLARLGPDAPADDRAKLLWNSAIQATERGDVAEGARLVDEALRLADAGSDLGVRARLRYTRAWILLQQRPPRAEEARDELRALLPEARQHGGALLLGPVLSELARAELVLGRPEVARRHAVASLERLDPSQHLERAFSHLLLGSASLALGEHSAGIELLEEAAAALQTVDASRSAASAWRQLADAYTQLGDHAHAGEALRRALDSVHVLEVHVAPADAQALGARRGRVRT